MCYIKKIRISISRLISNNNNNIKIRISIAQEEVFPVEKISPVGRHDALHKNNPFHHSDSFLILKDYTMNFTRLNNEFVWWRDIRCTFFGVNGSNSMDSQLGSGPINLIQHLRKGIS